MAIRCLGEFSVTRAGCRVPASEWQSRKARDLLKVLVCRRGAPTPREAVLEALWPDQDPAVTSHRLAVAMSIARSVLDPEHRNDRGHFLVSDGLMMHLRIDRVRVDVEEFLSSVAAGRRLIEQGRPDQAAALLCAAVDAYGGDFLEEDAYESWSASLRDQVRSAYQFALRAVARHAAGQDDNASAVRHFLRALDVDAYDESAHLGAVTALAASGSHGEARRRYALYAVRMEEIGVPPSPYPGPGPFSGTEAPWRTRQPWTRAFAV